MYLFLYDFELSHSHSKIIEELLNSLFTMNHCVIAGFDFLVNPCG